MDIEKKLLNTAFEEIRAQNLQIANGFEGYLTAFIKQGASNLQDEAYLTMSGADDEYPPMPTDEAFALQMAENNLIRFVNQMIGYALAQNENVLDKDSFWNIRDKICPLFPFC